MSEHMSDDEIEKLADRIVEKRGGGFYVDPEEHYNQHERLERFLDTYDSAGNIVFKFFLGLTLVGIVAAVAIGAGFHK